MNKNASIQIEVERDSNLNIENINWSATEAPNSEQKAKAMLLAFWDADSRRSLRIDLWTKGMTVQDMNDFFFQTFLSMAETYNRATNNGDIAADIKHFARAFAEKAVGKK